MRLRCYIPAIAGAVVLAMAGCNAVHNNVSRQIVIMPSTGNANTATGGNEATETVQKTFIAAKVVTLQVDGQVGSIAVQARPGTEEIHIEAGKSIRGSDSVEQLKALLPAITVSSSMTGSSLILSSAYPADYSKRNLNVSVSYIITVPPRIALNLRSASGAIMFSGIHGGVKAHTEFGNLDARESTGDLELSTSSGYIKIADSPEATSINAKTDFGAIDIQNSGGRIDADTNSGTVTATNLPLAKSLTLHSDFGNVSVTNGSGSIDASSDSGTVSVTNSAVSDSLVMKSDYGALDASGISGRTEAIKVDMQTKSGSATFNGDVTDLLVHSEFGSVNATVSNKHALRSADLHTSSGSSQLTLPSSASATVAASTSSGHIDVPGGLASPSSNEDGTQQTVIVGGGVAKVKISTGYGDAILKTE